MAAFDAQGALLQQKIITSPKDFVFKNGLLVTDETTVNGSQSTDYSKNVVISYGLNDRGNLVNHYEKSGAGMFLYVVPGVTRVRLNYEYKRLSN
ncbi:MAG: hypothetical protein B7X02_00590 [Rhodospirillales bacterium 12-54-5]|nr:MAG: hypothetical protein B7X02_00590 [Rhodospirillales bacterium 12-54-5]